MPAIHRSSIPLFLGFILLLPLLLLWRWALKGEVLFWGTLLLQFWPWHELAKTITLSGEWPLWNPYLGNGAPLLANLQTSFFYPPNLLYFALPVEHALTLSIILHLMLAGLLMVLFARQLGLQPFAATVSGLAYMLSGYLVGRTQFVVMVNAAAWYPLVLFFCERLVTRRDKRDVLWLGLTLAVQLLAGHAQLWFYALWLAGAYLIFRTWIATRRSNLKPLISCLLWFGLAVALAVLLSMAQLLPTAEFTLQSPRRSGAETTFALTYSFWPWRLVTLLMPNFFGHPADDNYWGYANYWEDHAYLGVLPLLLALVALWNYLLRNAWGPGVSADPTELPKNLPAWKTVPFFGWLIPISLILAMGWNTPVYLLVFRYIPGFGFFQAPARLLIWYTIAVAVLAGLGAESFKLSLAGRRGWQRLLVAASGLTMAGLAGSFILTGRSRTFLLATLMLGVWLIVAIVLLLQHPKRKGLIWFGLPRETIWQWAVLIFSAVDLLWAAFPLLPTLPATLFARQSASAAWLKAQPTQARYYVDEQFDYDLKFKHYFRFDSLGPTDLTQWQPLRESLIPNLGVPAGLASANNYDPLVVGRWQQLTDLLDKAGPERRARILGLMNVGYFIDAAATAAWPVLHANGRMGIQQVPNPLPRAYFVSRLYPAQGEAEVLARLVAPDFDSRQEVIIMDDNVNSGLNSSGSTVEAETPAAVTITQET
ncbi:MAG: YfhO family protein, partial [Anaerolineae bacterium]